MARFFKKTSIIVLVVLLISIIIAVILFSKNSTSQLDSSDEQHISYTDYRLFNLKETFDALNSNLYTDYKSELESQFSRKIAECDLESLLLDVPYFRGSSYYQQVVDSIELRAWDEGALSISKVYKAGIDSSWASVVEFDILEVIDIIPIEEHKELLPYYLGSEYQKAIFSAYYNRIEQNLSAIRYELMDSLLNDVNSFIGDKIYDDIAIIYDDFIGGFWGNISNNVFRDKEETNKLFDSIWNKQMMSKRYTEVYNKSIKNRYAYYKSKKTGLLSKIAITPTMPDTIPKLSITPNIEVMRNAVEIRNNIFYKNIAFTTVGVVTLPLGGWIGLAAFAGQTALDVGLDFEESFKDPEKNFITNEYIHVSNLITKHLYQMDKQLQENDSLIVVSIKNEYK